MGVQDTALKKYPVLHRKYRFLKFGFLGVTPSATQEPKKNSPFNSILNRKHFLLNFNASLRTRTLMLILICTDAKIPILVEEY